MKAVFTTRYGGADVLEIREADIPEIKPNEILVKSYASAVTRADVMMREGKPWFGRLFTGLTRPKSSIPGTGFAGKIVEIGEEVTEFAVGDDVFGEKALGFSAHAEFVAVPEDGVIARVPTNMSYDEAAPLTDGALTVHNFLTRVADIRPGQSVLINGAAGGLGTSAVQLARHLGAVVTAVASGHNEDLVRRQGAHHFIDYTREDITRGAERYDVIFDTVGKMGFSWAKRALTPNGTYLSPVISLRLLMQMMITSRSGGKQARFSATGLLAHDELRKGLEDIRALVEQGKMWTVIDKRFALDEIAQAHRHVDSGHKRGSAVLTIDHAPEMLMAAE